MNRKLDIGDYILLSIIVLSIIACTIIVLLISQLHAAGFTAFGIGASDAVSISLEVGRASIEGLGRAHMASIGGTLIFNADTIPKNTTLYSTGPGIIITPPSPYYPPYRYSGYSPSYQDYGWKQDGNEFALFGKYGIEVVRNSGVFATVLGGLAFIDRIHLIQSNFTGQYYEIDRETGTEFIFGGGIRSFPKDNNICVSIEYDDKRGITCMLGKLF